MKSNKTDNPGVVMPPPLIYVLMFFLSVLLNRLYALNWPGALLPKLHITGLIMIILSLVVTVSGLWKFLISKNTLITIRPSRSLQKKGIYSITRNPMYLGLLILYMAVATIKGNIWTFMVVPFLIAVIEGYVIKREELYLEREFGDDYREYKRKVRRWI